MLIRFAAVLAATCSSAALAEIKVERIRYMSGTTIMDGILAYDDAAKGKLPGVLVCHEWWGINDYAESRAKQLAALGYVAFALDLYGGGQNTTDPKVAGDTMGKLFETPKEVRERAAAGLQILAGQNRVDATKLGVIGYCMGGTVALELARSGLPNTENLRAVVAFHASTLAAKSAPDNKSIKGAVLVCHGQDDGFVKPEQITAFHKQMKDAGIDYEFVSYAGALHAFTNPAADKFGVPGVKYNEKADTRSWSAMKDLFTEVFSRTYPQSAKEQSKPAPSAPKPAEPEKPAKPG